MTRPRMKQQDPAPVGAPVDNRSGRIEVIAAPLAPTPQRQSAQIAAHIVQIRQH
jgi:hypothetical protein